MSDALNLALKISAVDLAGGVLNRFRNRVLGMGKDAERVQRDYTRMVSHITAGLKSIAIAGYGLNKIKPGIEAAENLQEAMLDVKQLLWQSGVNAGTLNKRLHEVRRTAVNVSANMPFSATDLAHIEANLKQGGVALQAIIGRQGAAFATAALSAISHMAPEAVSESVAKIGHAFQLSGKQYSQAADTLARVSTASSANLQELLYNLRQAGPAAHALGASLKQTSYALGAVASLGEQAGTDLKQFFNGMAGMSPQALKTMKKLNLSFFDVHGNFIGLHKSIERLRTAMKRVNNQQKESIYLQRIFGREGKQAALLLMQTGNKSYEEIKKSARAAASLQERLNIWAEGLVASLQKLSGSMKSTLANLFNPMLGPLTKAVNLTNTLVSNIGSLADKYKSVAQATSIGAAGLVGGAGIYGVYRLLRGVGPGSRVLKSILGNGAKTAAGIAEGKAVQAATGVSPVFVTNWPATFGGSATATSVERTAERVAKKGWKAALGLGALGLGGEAALWTGGTAAAAGGGYLAGHEIWKHGLEGTSVGRAIGSAVAHLWAGVTGSETAREAIQANQRAAQNARIHVGIEIDSDTRALVKAMHSDSPDVSVDVGHMMSPP